MSAPIPEPYSPPQEDIDYIDNFKCILCHQSLQYKPMEVLDAAEIGECPCHATFCARSILNNPNINQGIPVRDLVMNICGWTIAIPCHGSNASWSAAPYHLDANSPLERILLASSAIKSWTVKLEVIPDWFRNAPDASSIVQRLDTWLPFS